MMMVRGYREAAPDDPKATLLGWIAAIVSLVSAVVGSYASYEQGQQQSAAAKFNERVAQNNATAAGQQAQYQEQRIRDRNRRMLGMTRSSFLKSGVDLSGSAEDVLMDQAVQGEFDAAAAIYTGNVSITNQQNQAALFRSQGRNAESAGYWGVGTHLLSGASSGVDIAANPRFRNS